MASNETAVYLRYVADMYGYYTGLFNGIVGLIGNTMIILVFLYVKLFRGNQSSFYFIIESFSNIGLLLTIYSSRMFHFIQGYDPVLVYLIWCQLRTTFAQIFGLISLYTICSSSFDQFLSTNHRYSFRQKSSLKLAFRLVFPIVVLVILHSLLFLFFAEIRPLTGCRVYNSILTKYYSFFYYPILSLAVPFIVTIGFSLLAYSNVRRIVRRQMPIFRRRLDRLMTALVLSRVLCIVVCGLPYIIITLVELNMNNSNSKDISVAIRSLIGAICYSLLYTNFSINFFLFLLVSNRFRRHVKHFLFKQLCRIRCFSCCRDEQIFSQNQIVPELFSSRW